MDIAGSNCRNARIQVARTDDAHESLGRLAEQEVGTTIGTSQVRSGEIEVCNAIETLMRIAVKHAGAGRGLLILFTSGEPEIAAEATRSGGSVEVARRGSPITSADLPESVLQYAVRTHETVTLNDPSTSTEFGADSYLRRRRPRSVLCMPLIKQTELIGVLYLENKLAPRVFTSDRVALLKLVASQAAISLENARLYDELRRSEGFLTQGQRISHTGTFAWTATTGRVLWTEECYRIFGYDRGLSIDLDLAFQRVHPEDKTLVQRAIDLAIAEGKAFDLEYRLLMTDGSIKNVHVVGHRAIDKTGELEFIGTVRDITAAKQADEKLHKAHAALADVARVTALAELAASIAHELNQPLTAIVSNAEACRRWLDRRVPDIIEARATVEGVVNNGRRAAEVIRRVRALLNKTEMPYARLAANDVINEAIRLVQHEIYDNRVSIRTQFADDLPEINGDRIQLQQVLINLVINGMEAMQPVTDRTRELAIRTFRNSAGRVAISVEDCGVGIPEENVTRVFDPFFTTKPTGMGMGLAICRSIIEAHGGDLSVSSDAGSGATFSIVLRPVARNG